MVIRWFEDIAVEEVDAVGGKGASLGELDGAGFPVPPGFVVTVEAYRTFIEKSGIGAELFDAVDVDPDDASALAEGAERARELIEGAPVPDLVREEILGAYDAFEDDPFVAVRSSATAEDLPSIAADEHTLIKVDGEPVFDRIGEIAPIDCDRHSIEVPSLTNEGIAWTEVEQLYEHPAENERLYRITTSTGRQIAVSPDHSLVVLDENTLQPETISVDELEGDEKIPVVRELEPADSGQDTIDVTEYVRGSDVLRSDGGIMIDNDSANESVQHALPRTIQADEDFAYFLGLYIAEGSTYGANEVSITNTDDDVLGRALEFMNRIGLWNGQVKNNHSYRFHCKSLVRFLHSVAGEPDESGGKGRLAGNKRVPEFVFGWDRERIGHFLRGCFDGDGTVGDEIGYVTTSDRLVNGVARLLESVGIDYRLGTKAERDGWNEAYRIRIPAREAETFRETIGFENADKSERLHDLVGRHEEKEYYPEFSRTITVSEELSKRIRDRFEKTLPTEKTTIFRCPDCREEINKSSPYDGNERWYCPDCGAAYYEEGVTVETEERYCGRDESGRFKSGEHPWNKGRISGTYSQSQFDKLTSELGIREIGFDEMVAWENIERIEAIEYSGSVYDFCVPGAENFAAGRGGIITHNSASFAGQQETFLNVTREELIDRVRGCWASLFTERAMEYRRRQGFDHDEVGMAVVVQRMIDADRSGVMFTRDPATGDAEMVIEAAWGLGEGVVSGSVSPDTYVVTREGTPVDVTVADKKRAFRRDPETGETVEVEVGEDRRTARVLSEAELGDLVDLGRRVEDHYGEPQDVEWAMADGEVYLLQSRPITTIGEGTDAEDAGGVEPSEPDDGPTVSGLGASPGVVSGPARVVEQLDELDKVREGDVVVTPKTTPDMVPAMKRAVGLVTDEGGLTSHAAIVSRELGVPAVTGTGDATDVLADGRPVEVNGERGTVTELAGSAGADAAADDAAAGGTFDAGSGEGAGSVGAPAVEGHGQVAGPAKPMTATEVKVNVSLPSAAERAAAAGADGVGLLRLEHMVLEMGKTPATYIADHGPEAYVEELADGIRTVADAFYPRPVRVRTLDAPTDEFRGLEGGADEPVEPNPMLGFRGIRRSLAEPEVFEHELSTFGRLAEMGYDNVELMFPLVNDGRDVERLVDAMEGAGLDPDRQSWGVMVETPAAALSVEELVEGGVDFASFGTNDLTQYTLAVDRNNERIADRYDPTHPAVLDLMGRVIETCRANDVRTSICGEAASDPEMIRALVNEGITSISANIDAVADVQREVKRVEQRLIMDSVR